MRWINEFILAVPYLFLMKVPYLWLPAVVLYAWPPLISLSLSAVILLGLLAMSWQEAAWIEKVRREFSRDPLAVQILRERPSPAVILRSSLVILALSAVFGWVMNNYLRLNWLQWGLIGAGFIALYRKAQFFGRRVTYVFTAQGLAIRYVPGQLDYRILLRFMEIHSVERTAIPLVIPPSWTVISPTVKPSEGLLITSKNIDGFSKSIDRLLLCSGDLQSLSQKFPQALLRTKEQA